MTRKLQRSRKRPSARVMGTKTRRKRRKNTTKKTTKRRMRPRRRQHAKFVEMVRVLLLHASPRAPVTPSRPISKASLCAEWHRRKKVNSASSWRTRRTSVRTWMSTLPSMTQPNVPCSVHRPSRTSFMWPPIKLECISCAGAIRDTCKDSTKPPHSNPNRPAAPDSKPVDTLCRWTSASSLRPTCNNTASTTGIEPEDWCARADVEDRLHSPPNPITHDQVSTRRACWPHSRRRLQQQRRRLQPKHQQQDLLHTRALSHPLRRADRTSPVRPARFAQDRVSPLTKPWMPCCMRRANSRRKKRRPPPPPPRLPNPRRCTRRPWHRSATV